MQLDSLTIAHLRNLRGVALDFNPHFNVFGGENGGGKTSLLEAIHLLTTGRSFRARQSRQIITFGQSSCQITGLVSARDKKNSRQPIRMGVERYQTGSIKIRLAEEDCHSIALLAKTLPIQLINSGSYAILEAAPQLRRQFLDWAMFHVEHSFYSIWQRFKRALQQRNAALRETKLSIAAIQVWDQELIETGEAIHLQRQSLLKEFNPIFSEIACSLLNTNEPVAIQYHSGWNLSLSLQEALASSLERDRSWGYTTVGPHRADMELLLGNNLAKNVLSRGQLKLFICALLMARAELLNRRHQRHCVFLIDDLNAELDKNASQLLIRALARLGSQVLITTIERNSITALLEGKDYSLFQVQSGEIRGHKE